jgi:hypothetical protein
MMAQLTTSEYDMLERAIVDGSRVTVYKRGTEFVVVPRRLTLRDGREVIEATHPTTGDALEFALDEIDSIERV